MPLFILSPFYPQRFCCLWWKIPDGLIAAVEANYVNLSMLSLHNILLVPLLSACDGAISFVKQASLTYSVWICPWWIPIVTIHGYWSQMIFVLYFHHHTFLWLSSMWVLILVSWPREEFHQILYIGKYHTIPLLEIIGANMHQHYSKAHKMIFVKYCLILFFLIVKGEFIFFTHYTPVAWNIVLCIKAFINVDLHGLLINNIHPLGAKDSDLGLISIVYVIHF